MMQAVEYTAQYKSVHMYTCSPQRYVFSYSVIVSAEGSDSSLSLCHFRLHRLLPAETDPRYVSLQTRKTRRHGFQLHTDNTVHFDILPHCTHSLVLYKENELSAGESASLEEGKQKNKRDHIMSKMTQNAVRKSRKVSALRRLPRRRGVRGSMVPLRKN